MKGRLDGIAVFDSGMGGLDVAATISRLLPHEDIIYFGDNARVPYGTKSASMVRSYTKEAAHWLKAKGIKALVIACNTASAVIDREELEVELNIPVLGMVTAGVAAVRDRVLHVNEPKRIVVLATPGTVRSRAYQIALKAQYPSVDVIPIPCPLFVPLVEMGWENHALTPHMVEAQLRECQDRLRPVINRPAHEEVIYLLGCTHYPMMTQAITEGIARVDSSPFKCVDGAESVASLLKNKLTKRSLLRSQSLVSQKNLNLTALSQVENELGERYAYFSDEPNDQDAIELALRFWQNRGGVGQLSIQGVVERT